MRGWLQDTPDEARTAEKMFRTVDEAAVYTAGKVDGKLGKGFVCDRSSTLAGVAVVA